MSKMSNVIDELINEFIYDIKEVKQINDTSIDSIESYIEIKEEHILVLNLAKLNIISVNGVSDIVKSLEVKIEIQNIMLDDDNLPVDDKIAKKFINDKIKRLEEYMHTFKLIILKR